MSPKYGCDWWSVEDVCAFVWSMKKTEETEKREKRLSEKEIIMATKV